MTGNGHQRQTGSVPAIPILALVLVPLALFRIPVSGQGTWIGNPDRLNGQLKMLAFYVRGISEGRLDAWNEHEMLGFNAFSLPYTFPSPFAWLLAAADPQQLVVAAGWFSIGLLIAAGLCTYYFLRTIDLAPFESTIGALCYQLSTLVLLKVSQNDLSFAVLIVIPIGLMLIRQAGIWSNWSLFLCLSLVLATILHFMFLQKAAYALLLFGAYACWRSATTQRWAPIALLAATSVVATITSAPRIIDVAIAFSQYARETNDLSGVSFNDVYEFQNIRPHEIWRWFDYSIFGISPSDARRLGNNINLSEGFLLSTSAAVPILLLLAMPRFDGRWFGLLRRTSQDTTFWLLVLLLTILVVEWKTFLFVVYLAFLRIDFTHARILVVGLLPLCALVAIVLQHWRSPGTMGQRVGGLVAGMLVALAIAWAAGGREGVVPLARFPLFDHSGLSMRADACVRIIMSAIATLVIATLLLSSKCAAVAHAALAALIATQTFLAADMQINGEQTSGSVPFKDGDMYMARLDEFRPPTNQQIDELTRRVGTDRVALICRREIADGLCAGYVATLWRLRTVDGYYGLGVPTRIRALTWQDAIGLRTIAFTSPDALPWALLGFLNVGRAAIVTPTIYTNLWRDDGTQASSVTIIDNPEQLTPRAFLAHRAEEVGSAREAARRIFAAGKPLDVVSTSFVEGLSRSIAGGVGVLPVEFDSAGAVEVVGRGDTLEVDVSSTSGRRLLVLNELYHPGWRAFVDGIETPILAANSVMRAVVLPEAAKRVIMKFTPFVRTTWAAGFYAGGFLLLILGMLLGSRCDGSARERKNDFS